MLQSNEQYQILKLPPTGKNIITAIVVGEQSGVQEGHRWLRHLVWTQPPAYQEQ